MINITFTKRDKESIFVIKMSNPQFCLFNCVGGKIGNRCMHISKKEGYCKQHYDKLKLEYLEKIALTTNTTIVEQPDIEMKNVELEDEDVKMEIMG